MPRPLRPAFEGAVYHAGTRGVARCPPGGAAVRRGAGGKARCPIYTDEVDRTRFLELLARTVDRHAWRCHAYCLMTTHYHLLIETPDADVSQGMQYLNGCYAQWFNRRHGRGGHLFGERFGARVVTAEPHLVETCRYIVLNPVRAGLCTFAEEWPWSSHAAKLGLRPRPPFLTVSWLLDQFGPDPATARAGYAHWVAARAVRLAA